MRPPHQPRAQIPSVNKYDRWYDLWSSLTRARIMRMYRLPFLAQPAPLPETMIGADPRSYLEGRFKRGGPTLSAWLDPSALEDFGSFCEPARIQASCEYYRAGATCDVDHDEADQKAGRQIKRPLLLLWGDRGNLADMPDPLALWRRWCPTISGHAVDSGHFIAEENPTALLAAVLPFLEAGCRRVPKSDALLHHLKVCPLYPGQVRNDLDRIVQRELSS